MHRNRSKLMFLCLAGIIFVSFCSIVLADNGSSQAQGTVVTFKPQVQSPVKAETVKVSEKKEQVKSVPQPVILNSGKENEPGWKLDRETLLKRINVMVVILVLSWLIIQELRKARRGESVFIRRIAGLAALDEAVGRATEMGRPVMFICGTQDMDDIQTLAGLSILGSVAQKTAEYETPILVPASRSLVMSTAYEVVKESYLKVGKPDLFQGQNVRYLTDDQFGFVAGVDGIMMREKPAANFFMGSFWAESLILVETGNSIGSIQVAGTANPSQLPFFVAACDYTLIGEEMFAASAYLSKDPQQIGSLKGQDYGKAVLIGCVVVGVVLETIGITYFTSLFSK